MGNLNIPEGYQQVMPYLIIRDASGFLEFMKTVFGVSEKLKHEENGVIRHGEICLGNSTIMFAESTEQWKAENAGLFVYVEDADETYRKAIENGASSLLEPMNQSYGRSGGVKDAYGNTWWITSVIK